jgi:hypothetical protein
MSELTEIINVLNGMSYPAAIVLAGFLIAIAIILK